MEHLILTLLRRYPPQHGFLLSVAWTVNRARAMKKFADLGADGIISDDTLLLSNTLRDQ